MHEEFKKLFVAPWSKQKVGMIGRVLSLTIFIVIIFVVVGTAKYIFQEGINVDQIWFVLIVFCAGIYSLIFMGHVIIKGEAPTGWFPW